MTTTTGCIADNVDLSVAGPHGGTMEIIYASCDEAITTHEMASGEVIDQSFEMPETLRPGNYVITANFIDPDTSWASHSFSVE
jgi:hypothetical protein